MKRNFDESDEQFQTRRFTLTTKIFTWSGVSTLAAIIVAVDIIFGWNEKLTSIINLPDKVSRLSDIVWQDHQTLQRIGDKLNMQNLESPKEKSEISQMYGNTNIMVALTSTNIINP